MGSHHRNEVAVAPPVTAGPHLLVVIDHREARVYQTELHGSVPQRITPYNSDGFGRHLRSVQDEGDGRRKPERESFYEAVAGPLRDAEKILIFGSGAGASSAMEQLLSELLRRHPDRTQHIIGAVVVDESHLTEDQLLAQARQFYEEQ